MKRESGVLLHITSLPNEQGIGTFGKAAYEFVDFLIETKQTYWQILPLGTTSFGDSPYQSFSAFAGNTNLIDFDLLVEQGLLTASDYQTVHFGDDATSIDYGLLFQNRKPVLEIAVKQFIQQFSEDDQYLAFLKENHSWLDPFCEYMAIKEYHNHRPWYEWPETIQQRQPQIIADLRAQLKDEMIYHQVTQYFFYQQWYNLKDYANKNHIQIIGDMPIYVSGDSVEMWTTPQYFKTNEEGKVTAVAGCPPDRFAKTGQLWGNPLYDWDFMEKDHYDWWVERLRISFQLYDVVRIDHFRGFDEYWEIPAEHETAEHGQWMQGPGMKLFTRVKEVLGDVNIIAEDLGFMKQTVIELRENTGFPGMKILQNGFYGQDSGDLPHHYPENSVAYVGTHDNQTGLGWYLDTASSQEQERVRQYLHVHADEKISDALNRGIAASPSRMAIYTMQDLLNLDNKARMNVPSTIGLNWKWRLEEDYLTSDLKDKLRTLTTVYFRKNDKL